MMEKQRGGYAGEGMLVCLCDDNTISIGPGKA